MLTFGLIINIHNLTFPLLNVSESECEWEDNEENTRRREFCNHIEGYGSVCSCTEPASLIFNPEPVIPVHFMQLSVKLITLFLL